MQDDAPKATRCERVIAEMASGSGVDRLGLGEERASARDDPGDPPRACEHDRVGRSSPHLVEAVESLDGRGIGLGSPQEVADTNAGKLALHAFAALPESDRDPIRERTAAGPVVARARCRARRGAEIIRCGETRLGPDARRSRVERRSTRSYGRPHRDDVRESRSGKARRLANRRQNASLKSGRRRMGIMNTLDISAYPIRYDRHARRKGVAARAMASRSRTSTRTPGDGVQKPRAPTQGTGPIAHVSS
jgi:DNA invertase Pin-like site-specific DNA recombinase